MTHTTDPLGDAITVLENVKIEDPSARMDTEDAHNRVNLALDYLRMIGTTRVLSPTDPPFDPHPEGYPRLNEIAAIASAAVRYVDARTPERNGTTLPVRFIVNGQAAAQGSKNAFVLPGTRRAVLVDTDKKLKPWRAAVAAAAAEARGDQPLLAGPVRVRARFIFPRPKSHFGTGRNADVLKRDAPSYVTKAPDVDKLQRAIGDSLTGVVYMDDSQIAEWQAVKVYGSHSCTQIEVTPLKGDAPSE